MNAKMKEAFEKTIPQIERAERFSHTSPTTVQAWLAHEHSYYGSHDGQNKQDYPGNSKEMARFPQRLIHAQ